jgi:hypothetical protein
MNGSALVNYQAILDGAHQRNDQRRDRRPVGDSLTSNRARLADSVFRSGGGLTGRGSGMSLVCVATPVGPSPMSLSTLVTT